MSGPRPGSDKRRPYDAILLGAGPAGLAAAVAFKQAGVRYCHLERGLLAQTIRSFPNRIRLYSGRRDLELPGLPFVPAGDRSPTREEYLAYLRAVAQHHRLKITTCRETVSVDESSSGFEVTTVCRNLSTATVRASNLVVATGGYFTPVRLHIPGEDGSRVSHYFKTSRPARDRRVVVVGGRNSAIEAAVNLAKKKAWVTLVYHKARLPRKAVKPWLLPQFEAARQQGRIAVLYSTAATGIRDDEVELRTSDGKTFTVRADWTYLLTGYGPGYDVLRKAGVPFDKAGNRPAFDPGTLETACRGVFLCGTIVLTWLGERASIENTRSHGRIILENLRDARG